MHDLVVPEVAVVDSPRQQNTAWPTFAAAAAAADWSRVVVVVLEEGRHRAAAVVAEHLNMVAAAVAVVVERSNRACRVDIQDRKIPRMDQWAVVDGWEEEIVVHLNSDSRIVGVDSAAAVVVEGIHRDEVDYYSPNSKVAEQQGVGVVVAVGGVKEV